jgi:hypothetical protein
MRQSGSFACAQPTSTSANASPPKQWSGRWGASRGGAICTGRLLYAQGYFRQVIDRTGAQQVLFQYNDPGQLPIAPLRNADGEWLRLHITLPGYSIWLRAWQVQVGSLALYLLDSNDRSIYPLLVPIQPVATAICAAVDCVRSDRYDVYSPGTLVENDPITTHRAPFHVLAVGKCSAVRALLERIVNAGPRMALGVFMAELKYK